MKYLLLLLLSVFAFADTQVITKDGKTTTVPGDLDTLHVITPAAANTIPPATQLVDSAGGVWTVVGGVVMLNGQPAGFTQNVTLLLYYNNLIYQQNQAGNWWSWTGSTWIATTDPRVPPPSGGLFSVSPAGFKNSTGQTWTMRGLNAGVVDLQKALPTVLQQYPGLTAVRLNTGANDSTTSIDQIVTQLNSKGIVVEIEDHSGNQNNVSWYQQMALKYKSNPLVFLETPNEPGDPNTANNQIGIIKAIRAQGFQGPVGIQPIGGYDFSNIQTVTNAVGKTNLFVTPHIYYAGTDPNGPAAYVQADINTAKNLGLYPSIDEFGDAMDGWHRDQYGPQVITATIAANKQGTAGAVFWALANGNHPDGADSACLSLDCTQLTPVGQNLKPWLSGQ